MTQKANQIAALALTFLVGLTACDKKKADEVQSPSQGDPYVLVKDTNNNDNEPLPQFLFTENSDWAMEVKGFAQNPAVNLEQEFRGALGAELGQNPADKIVAYQPYRMIKSQDNVWSVFQPTNATSVRINFVFSGTAAKPGFKVDEVVLNNVDLFEKEQYRVFHTSYSETNDAISILLYSEKPGNHRVVALYFYKWKKPVTEEEQAADPLAYESTPVIEGQPVVVNEVKVEKPFNYLYGQKYKATWDRHVVVKVCGLIDADLQGIAKGSVEQWKARVDGGMNLDHIIENAKCPPFSDLQTQTFTYVDGWTEPANASGRVTGKTISVANLATGHILDGDIFVYMTELQKSVPENVNIYSPRALNFPQVRADFDLAALKSMGFLLGLGQAPSGTPSVMTSDIQRAGVTDYDREAILSLYDNSNWLSSTWNKLVW